MFVAVSPSSTARASSRWATSVGELAVVLLGVLLVGDQLVGEAPRAGLQLEVVGRESVHVAPLSFGDRAKSSPLTDCSVYATLARHDHCAAQCRCGRRRRRDHRRLDRLVPAAIRARRRRAARARHPRPGRQRARRRDGARPGRHRGRRPARAVQPRLLPRPAATCSGIDSGFVEQGYFMPCFTDAEVEQAHARIAMQQAVGLDVRWVERRRGRRDEPGDGARADARGVVRRRATATSTRRATCWPTPRRCSRPASQVRERTAFTGLVVDGGRVTGVRTSAATSRPSGWC